MEQAFAEFLAGVIAGGAPVQWRQAAVAWQNTPLEAAFQGYQWRGEDYCATTARLNVLRGDLRDALSRKDGAAVRRASKEILRWGGVYNGGNAKWLRQGTDDCFLAALMCALELAQARDFDEERFRQAGTRSNAGLTKVHALALDNFIIYDSRVAAALQMLVVMFLEATQADAVPDLLAFAGMASKSTRTHRQAAYLGISFPRTHNRHQIHMRCNLAANRVLALTLALVADMPGAAWCAGKPDALRRLEAALFMVGYDLPPAFRDV